MTMANQADQLLQPDEPEVTKVTHGKGPLSRGIGGGAFHPFLFAAYPVLLLYSDNLSDVPVGDVIGAHARRARPSTRD